MANIEISDSPIDSRKRADKLNRKAGRKRRQAARKEKRADKAEAKGKTGRAAILRGKAKKKTGKAEVKEARADRAENRGKKIKAGAKKAVAGAKKLHGRKKEIKGKVKDAVKGKVSEAKDKAKAGVDKAKKAVSKAKTGAKAKVKETKDKVKAGINKAATAVAGATAPGMYGANKHDYKEHMDAAGHETKDGVVGGGKYGKGGHYKDYEASSKGTPMHGGPAMADSNRLTGAGSEGDPGLGRMSEGPALGGYGKISYGSHQKPTMDKGNGKPIHGSPFSLGGSKLSRHFKK